jgi:hypothetical protein
MYPPAIAFIERKRAEGMSTREALRCLKRHLTRVVFKTMLRAEQSRCEKATERFVSGYNCAQAVL